MSDEDPGRNEYEVMPPAPCVLCGRILTHVNDGGHGWLAAMVYEGRVIRRLYCHDYGCVPDAERVIWRCPCEPDYCENIGPVCANCKRPRIEAEAHYMLGTEATDPNAPVVVHLVVPVTYDRCEVGPDWSLRALGAEILNYLQERHDSDPDTWTTLIDALEIQADRFGPPHTRVVPGDKAEDPE